MTPKRLEEVLDELRPLARFGSMMGKRSYELAELIKHVETHGWIPVELALPSDGEEVLIYSESKYGVRQGEYSAGTGKANWHDVFGNYAGSVTHWQPLPPPP